MRELLVIYQNCCMMIARCDVVIENMSTNHPEQLSTHKGRSIHLGFFNDPKIAHQHYSRAAKKLFGEFARME